MNLALVLTSLGLLFLAGLAADMIGRRTRLPRVTLLLALGIVFGRSGLDLMPDEAMVWFEFLSTVALSLVAFLLGGSLQRKRLAAQGREIVGISLAVVICTVALVSAGLIALGVSPDLALLLGALACATDPAATRDTLMRRGGAGAGFATKIEGIVAIDDAWGLMVFGLAMVLAHSMGGQWNALLLLDVAREIGGAVVLGLAIGVPGAYLTGRVTPGEPLRAEALGLVFLTAGLALWLEVSFLIAAMTVGAVIVNRARHHRYAFDEIEHFQWPFMLLFFLLAGASLDLGALWKLGWLGGGYIVLRVLARLIGASIGARLCGSPPAERDWFGPALMAQAGVAVGMALIAAEQFPAHAETILTLTIGATVVFELVGPLGVALAQRRVEAASNLPGRDL